MYWLNMTSLVLLVCAICGCQNPSAQDTATRPDEIEQTAERSPQMVTFDLFHQETTASGTNIVFFKIRNSSGKELMWPHYQGELYPYAVRLEASEGDQWRHVMRLHTGAFPLLPVKPDEVVTLRLELPFREGEEPNLFRICIGEFCSPAYSLVQPMPEH